jgi:hypothetical protein
VEWRPSGAVSDELQYRDQQGHTYIALQDGYFLDPKGTLRITLSPSEGYNGIRKILLNRADYPVFERSCRDWVERVVYPPLA